MEAPDMTAMIKVARRSAMRDGAREAVRARRRPHPPVRESIYRVLGLDETEAYLRHARARVARRPSGNIPLIEGAGI